jgi:hypothetical protein
MENVHNLFPSGKPSEKTLAATSIVPGAGAAVVRSGQILDLPSTAFVTLFPDRIPPYDFQAFHFFRDLKPSRTVRVHMDASRDWETAVLSLETKPGGAAYFVSFPDFVRYVHPDGAIGSYDEAESYLSHVLRAFRIEPSEKAELPSATVVVSENFKDFLPETIPFLDGSEPFDGANIFSRDPKNWVEYLFGPESFIRPEKVNLLQALSCLYVEFSENGYEFSPEDYLVLSKSVSGKSIAIRFDLFRPAILAGIDRAYQEYAGLDEDERMDAFFDDHVGPELA